eukprot:3208906-Pyramimonas_sp.AAC.1
MGHQWHLSLGFWEASWGASGFVSQACLAISSPRPRCRGRRLIRNPARQPEPQSDDQPFLLF